MHKTIVVEVERRVQHGEYTRTIKRTSRFHAHDEGNTAKVGDRVRIEETRPLSKLKRWRLREKVLGLNARSCAPMSTNTRNKAFDWSWSDSIRSLRMEYSAMSSIDFSRRSGGTDGRPVRAYMRVKDDERSFKTSSANTLIATRGCDHPCFAGMLVASLPRTLSFDHGSISLSILSTPNSFETTCFPRI